MYITPSIADFFDLGLLCIHKLGQLAVLHTTADNLDHFGHQFDNELHNVCLPLQLVYHNNLEIVDPVQLLIYNMLATSVILMCLAKLLFTCSVV